MVNKPPHMGFPSVPHMYPPNGRPASSHTGFLNYLHVGSTTMIDQPLRTRVPSGSSICPHHNSRPAASHGDPLSIFHVPSLQGSFQFPYTFPNPSDLPTPHIGVSSVPSKCPHPDGRPVFSNGDPLSSPLCAPTPKVDQTCHTGVPSFTSMCCYPSGR